MEEREGVIECQSIQQDDGKELEAEEDILLQFDVNILCIIIVIIYTSV